LPSVQIVDFNVALHDDIRSVGARVVYGDISSPDTLQQTGVAEAQLVISTVPDELLKKTSNVQIARMVRSLNPNAVIITHATRVGDIDAHLEAGADDVFFPAVEAATAVMPALRAGLSGDITAYIRDRRLAHGGIRARRHVFD
jgi:voltage-gated potassium channel Kch